MTLEENAQEALEKLDDIGDVAVIIRRLAEGVLYKEDVDGEDVELSPEDKQKLLQKYQTKKAELQKLVSELP